MIGCARVLAVRAVGVTLARLASTPSKSYRAVAIIRYAVLTNSDSSKPVFADALSAVNTGCSDNATENSIRCSCMHKANSHNMDCHFKSRLDHRFLGHTRLTLGSDHGLQEHLDHPASYRSISPIL